jgi:hypothetical protein
MARSFETEGAALPTPAARLAAIRSRTRRGSEPIAVPSAPPRTTIAVSKGRVIAGIRRRRGANRDRAAAMTYRAPCCDGCSLLRASGRTRDAFTHRRRRNISGRGAWRRWRDGPVGRLRHGIGARGIEHGRRQRRRGRNVLPLGMFDHDAHSKHNCASVQQQMCDPLKSPYRHRPLL